MGEAVVFWTPKVTGGFPERAEHHSRHRTIGRKCSRLRAGRAAKRERQARRPHLPDACDHQQLAITNKEKKQVHLNKVTLSFTGPPSVPKATIPVPTNWAPPDGGGINIAPGGMKTWNFLRESFENDTVLLGDIAPPTMTLELFFDGFSSPWSTTRNLVPHKNPVTGDAYLFPAQFDDLKAGEFWGASSNTHGTGNVGSQLYAYDMNVVGWDDKAKKLNRRLTDKNGDHNEDYRIYGKKVHAMADGVVVQFVNDCPNNDPPLANQFKKNNKAYNDALWKTQTNNFWGAYDKAHGGESKVHAGAGNHFYIQHGEEIALYAHMQKGTLDSKLLTVGAQVKAGDMLGLAGNSGNSSEPHLHIHAVKGTKPETGPLRPLLFRDMFAIDLADLKLPDRHAYSVRARRSDRQTPSSGRSDETRNGAAGRISAD